MTYLITKHPVISPVYLLSPLSIQHLHFLRLARSPYKIREHGVRQRIKSFSCSGSKVWNCIPLDIRTLSKHKFIKAAINRQLFDIVLFEDEDVDTLTVTSRFKQL